MIEYSHGRWGIRVLLQLRGSVIPKALVWSVPCAAITVLLHQFWDTEKGDQNKQMEGIDQIWSKFTFVLGFLIVFRSNQAYSRFWESVTLFHQISGEWMSAFSNLLSFCSADPQKQAAVVEFRQYLIRLMSLLHCNALQTLCELDDDRLEVVDLGGINRTSLLHLKGSPDRCETVLLWLERFIIEADKSKTLDVPAPILSRAFQELSRGMVGVTNVRKIRDVPFPFPYSQFLSFILVVHWLVTPIVASQIILKPWWAGIMVFSVVTSYWTLYYIAQEIDQPFGEDANDLPVREMQRHFNEKLDFFISPLSCAVPEFNVDASYHIQMLSSTFSVALSNSVASPSAGTKTVEAARPNEVESAYDLVEDRLEAALDLRLNSASGAPSQEIIEVTLAKGSSAPVGCCTVSPDQPHATICFSRQAATRENSEVDIGLPAGTGEEALGACLRELEELKQLLAMLPGRQDRELAEMLRDLAGATNDQNHRSMALKRTAGDAGDPMTELPKKLNKFMASESLKRLDPDRQQKLRLLNQRLQERFSRLRRV
ncbi:unnamed protein product [Symbiodinium microadriaticum]|nr:unnamed protein product [Symbiodinium microadriaticum]